MQPWILDEPTCGPSINMYFWLKTQVRFNPANTNMLASGSLDHLVNIWQLNTGHRLQHHDFGKLNASSIICYLNLDAPWFMHATGYDLNCALTVFLQGDQLHRLPFTHLVN